MPRCSLFDSRVKASRRIKPRAGQRQVEHCARAFRGFDANLAAVRLDNALADRQSDSGLEFHGRGAT